MSTLRGVYIVLTTPFLENGDLDFEGFGKNLDNLANSAVQGIMVAGALGEYLSMTLAERMRLVEFTANKLNKKIPFVVGTTAHWTRDVIELSNHALAHDASGVMILPPPGTGLLQDEIFLYYKEITANVHGRIMLYNNPYSSGMDMDFDLVRKLAELPHVCCIKEASGDIKRITRMREELGDEFTIFCGWEDMHHESFCAGAGGWVCMGGNFAPRLTRELFELVKTGELGKARKLSKAYNPVARHLESAGKVTQTTKYIMDKCGMVGGFSRAPKQGLTVGEKQAVDTILRKVSLY
ncbi:MAG: dihydrodipicolinate synthase family protein [Salinivirgaceae bacterium]|nr:dihydrodipicolinate synthase family protein [Salinivirgaceae bacterium]